MYAICLPSGENEQNPPRGSGSAAPLGYGVQPDRKDTRRNVLGLGQSGLGLPDRDDYFRTEGPLTEAQRASLMAELGLSDPIWQQYLNWVRDVAAGNFGKSFFRSENVADMILGLPPTIIE